MLFRIGGKLDVPGWTGAWLNTWPPIPAAFAAPGATGSCGWPFAGQICPFWHPQRTRLQTNCLLPLPCRWLCTHRRPSTSNRTRPQPRHTTRTGRPPSCVAIAAVGIHCITMPG